MIRKTSFLFLTAALVLTSALGYTQAQNISAECARADEKDPWVFSTAEDGSKVLTAYNGSAVKLALPTEAEGASSYSIGEGVFANDDKLSVVTVPSCVTGIGAGAFENCKRLISVNLPEGLQTIGASAFAGTALVKADIPATVSAIGANAFDGCSALSTLTFKEGETSLTIGESAFYTCTSLWSVSLPARLGTVGQNAFDGCVSLHWAYLKSSALKDGTRVFPDDNDALTVVFEKKEFYDSAKDYFSAGVKTTYIVPVNFHVEGITRTIEKLYGEKFALSRNTDSGSREHDGWILNAVDDLPVQDESYAKTVWYEDEALSRKTTLAAVDARLQSEANLTAIDLYAHATLLPFERLGHVSYAYDKDGYDLSDPVRAAELIGIENFEDAEALVFTVYGGDGQNAERLLESGDYIVTVSLNENYGVWKGQTSAMFTIEKDGGRLTKIMLAILAILGLMVVVLTLALVIVRGQRAKRKRKELTSEELIDRYIASGGRTRLKK